MEVTASARAAEVVTEMGALRSGTLTVTIGTGCCESTAPFLYEDFYPGADQEPVGEVAGVVIYAPAYLRRLYPGAQGPRLEVVEDMGDSLSVETELGVRLALRGTGLDSVTDPEVCAVPEGGDATGSGRTGAPIRSARPIAARAVTGRPPPGLEGLRLR
ncbi:DUF779 domain-containing protein [Iamia sp.]|uniref:DUF779 domain-containing protein n=1 Tax=Iamia sp. TaxID=2722710 RepID=UPI002BE5513C|nr:DUF779 domain-containing protein [Iamia sp.]HXH57158.1 DUF779 domain-containing protein [Iamia sp.]